VKYNRFFRILAVAVVLSLLMIAIPAIPASAAPVISLSVEKGGVGDKVTINGSGFPIGSKDQRYEIYFSSDALDVGEELDYYSHYYKLVNDVYTPQGSGSFLQKVITIPAVLDDGDNVADVQGGSYYCYVTSGGKEEVMASAEFTVIGVNELNPDSGPVGTEVEISGVGFDGGDDITVKYDGNEVSIVSGDRKVKTSGIFTSRIDIPPSAAGAHTITVEDEAQPPHSGQIQFTVDPQITLNPAPASAGDELTVSGTGFGVRVGIFVYFAGDEIYIIGDNETDASGSFESTFLVPSDMLPGSYDVEVEDDDGNAADMELEVGAGLTVEPVTTTSSPGHVGDTVTVSGNGFEADHDITITYTSTPVEFFTTSLADGTFSYPITIPPSAAGEHTISATDGTNTKEVTFIMESIPPEAPAPLLPEMDTKAKSKAEFDWGDVSDDSLPMTYELQVATNSQFTADSILVSKIGLTTSTYTLSDEEKLESTSEEAPYYWRVRAKDGASNPSDWSSGSRFIVGSGFSMPGWLLYTLIAIGAILIFFLGVWIGRRSATSEDYYY
jgi:hypothetical protein